MYDTKRHKKEMGFSCNEFNVRCKYGIHKVVNNVNFVYVSGFLEKRSGACERKTSFWVISEITRVKEDI